MNDFSYFVVSSILHDQASVDAIFRQYLPLLDEASGRRMNSAAGFLDGQTSGFANIAPDEPVFFFVLTGGTEGIVQELLLENHAIESRLPVLIIAHPGHNSLPAALEILAWVRQKGGVGEIILIKSPSDKGAAARIRALAQAARTMLSLRRTRIGAIGEPSDWLIASSQKAEALKAVWGPELVQIPVAALQEKMKAISPNNAESPADRQRIEDFMHEADFCREASAADMDHSNLIYEGLRSLCEGFGLDALTLRCFDLVSLDGSTGCYALSQLADEGIDAGCEGDIPSILALHCLRLLTGKAAWMANPASIELGSNPTSGRLLLAHCTVPRNIVASYGIRSHFESGLGLAISGTFRQTPVTLFRIGGKELGEAWVAEGQLAESPHEEGLCRTQALIEMENAELSLLLERPLGNHLVMAPGRWKAQLLTLLGFLGIARLT
ncbi:MAG: hypothetical protein LLF89_02105 [Spirochaetaceae bacterium]|nr:hypothetical protein [Spirochaetaceae bacterium]